MYNNCTRQVTVYIIITLLYTYYKCMMYYIVYLTRAIIVFRFVRVVVKKKSFTCNRLRRKKVISYVYVCVCEVFM